MPTPSVSAPGAFPAPAGLPSAIDSPDGPPLAALLVGLFDGSLKLRRASSDDGWLMNAAFGGE